MFSLLKKDEEKRQRRQLQAAAIVLMVAAVLVFGGVIIMISAQSVGALKFAGAYTGARVVPGSYSNTIECSGTVQPIRVTPVTTKAPGSVSAVYVTEGQYVRQGTVLFEVREGAGEPQQVTASATGTVMDMHVAVGMTGDALAAAGYAMQIADMNVLVGVVKVPEFVSVLLENGEYVSMSSPVTPQASYHGILTGLSKDKTVELNASGQALYDATIMFDDTGALRVGDPIIAQMHVEDYGQVFYVPAGAVEEINGIAYVQIMRVDGTVEQHQVELLGTADTGEKIVKSDVLSTESTVRADLSE